MARKKRKKRLTLFGKLFLLLIFILIIIIIKGLPDNNKLIRVINKNELVVKKEKYNECLLSKYDESELTSDLNELIESTNDKLKKYNIGVKYEDLTSGFSYGYKEDEVFYGASLIKLVDAIYIYDNNIDFNKTLTYKAQDRHASSSGMNKHKINDQVTIKELMKYAISVSDNTAHIMLFNFIGEDNLKEYGKSLGAKVILTGGDKYGNQTASDTNIYLKEAYKIINEKENGNYLKEIMTNDYQNYLPLDNEPIVAHKYGSYEEYFHNIGIVFDEYPYTISILTSHGKGNYQKIIKDVHQQINEIHKLYRDTKEKSCYQKTYIK